MIGRALVGLLDRSRPEVQLAARPSDPEFYRHLWVTISEVATGLVIGGLAGLAVGIVLGANPFLSKAFERMLYYLGPTPKIIFFPIMIMWFGVGPGSKVAMGDDLVLLPDRARASRPACGRSTSVLIRVGRSFRAQHLADGDQDLSAGDAPADHQRRAARPRRRDHRHAAGRDQALQSRHRLPDHQRLQHVRHAAHVCAADRAVRGFDRRPMRWSAAPAGGSEPNRRRGHIENGSRG